MFITAFPRGGVGELSLISVYIIRETLLDFIDIKMWSGKIFEES